MPAVDKKLTYFCHKNPILFLWWLFPAALKNMGINEVIAAPQSPWQNPYVERLIGSIRRDCLNHVIVLNEKHLKQILSSYFEYYHNDRTHCGLAKDTPVARPTLPKPNTFSKVIKFKSVGQAACFHW